MVKRLSDGYAGPSSEIDRSREDVALPTTKSEELVEDEVTPKGRKSKKHRMVKVSEQGDDEDNVGKNSPNPNKKRKREVSPGQSNSPSDQEFEDADEPPKKKPRQGNTSEPTGMQRKKKTAIDAFYDADDAQNQDDPMRLDNEEEGERGEQRDRKGKQKKGAGQSPRGKRLSMKRGTADAMDLDEPLPGEDQMLLNETTSMKKGEKAGAIVKKKGGKAK